ncbi:MAG: hypothetical protein AB8B61_10385 [Cyclobacteriaceae bacterium]
MFRLFGQTNSELKFTKLYLKKLQKEVKGLKLVNFKELEIKTKYNGEDLTHYLDNAYSEYERKENNKNEVINRYIQSTLTLYQPTPKFSNDQIIPNIKDRRYIEELKKFN